MAELSGLRLAVAGAGVFGLCTALRAAAAGARVEVWDPAPLADNASGVAAGMIAPASEVLLDNLCANTFELLRAGRDGWRDIASLAPGLIFDPSGTIILFSSPQALASAKDRLAGLSGSAHTLNASELRALPTSAGRCALFTPEDWRVEPKGALAALKAAIISKGGVFTSKAMTPADIAAFDAVVLAAGIGSAAFCALAPELLQLAPIKGQIVRFGGGPSSGPMLRTAEVYLVPQPGGALVGATMEFGRNDVLVEGDVIDELRRRALELAPSLNDQPYRGFAGVRASTTDGLPMAGLSSRPGLLLATGARRNGWLLAPLVSEILLSYLSGGDGGPFAAALAPRRFACA